MTGSPMVGFRARFCAEPRRSAGRGAVQMRTRPLARARDRWLRAGFGRPVGDAAGLGRGGWAAPGGVCAAGADRVRTGSGRSVGNAAGLGRGAWAAAGGVCAGGAVRVRTGSGRSVGNAAGLGRGAWAAGVGRARALGLWSRMAARGRGFGKFVLYQEAA